MPRSPRVAHKAPVMGYARCQKRLGIWGFSATSIKFWRIGAFSPSHLSGPPRKQNVLVCYWWLVCFWVHTFETSDFGCGFLKSGVSFTLAINFFGFIYTETWQVWIVPIELPNPKKHRYGRVKTKRYLPANIYFCSFCSLLPPLFYKHSGCYGNGLIDVVEKPKILKRFWQRRSRVIGNSCNARRCFKSTGYTFTDK